MTDLVIIGTGTLAREVAKGVGRINKEQGAVWNLLGFVDEEKTGELMDYPILGKLEDFLKMDRKVQFFVADMDGYVRERIAKICKAAGFTGASIVDVEGRKGVGCTCGEGSYVAYKTFLSPMVKVGDFCIVEWGAVVGHDTVVGDYSNLGKYANLGGDSVIGAHTDLGFRSTIINMMNTPDHCKFAAGSCVIKNTTQSGYYEGVPAKLVRPYEGGDQV